ncbi:MAG TPA: Hpt domain-containing protein [Vicinamibacterales bacterium]|jgi:HPt (histidine-containing phosphotransfer) domain-containing protein|nr:Hpt domain-containing protein [Vicinamibacterales bacterium]
MTQVSTQELSSLDLSVMAAMRSLGETDVFAEAAGMFLENVPPDLSALSAAIAGGSAASVAQIAHSLRGNALGIGAIRMAPICIAIENAAHAGSLAEAAASARRLEREFEAARQALQALIQ